MIADLLGLTTMFFVGAFCLLLAKHRPTIAKVLLVAFFVRATAALFHYYIAPLPDGSNDAVIFEKIAWEWAQGGLNGWAVRYPGIDSFFISWIIAFFIPLLTEVY